MAAAPSGETESSWRDPFAPAVVLFLVLALAIGGSSSHPVSAGVVRAVAVPVLAWSVWRQSRGPVSSGAAWPIGLLLAAVALVLAQLIPLPPSLWQALPGRRTIAEAYAAAGMALPWAPASLAPWATLDAGLGLIAPAAMVCAVLTLGGAARRALVTATLAMAAVSVGLGMLQMAGGQESPLRFWPITNPESAVGLFANRNHQAAFLAAGLPLAAALATVARGQGGPRLAFTAIAAGAYALVIGLGAVLTGSRAGAVLVVVGFIGALFILVWRRRGGGSGGGLVWVLGPALALAAAMALTVGLIAASGDTALTRRLREGPQGDLRLEFNATTARAGLVFAPVGAGAGAFRNVYPMFEPVRTLGPAYINHAHDDYLETWLESGVAGVSVIAAFLAWWVAATGAILRRRGPADALAMAGAVVVAMLLVHSAVDYPLRTPALAVIFALACGLMLPAPAAPVRPDGAFSPRRRG